MNNHDPEAAYIIDYLFQKQKNLFVTDNILTIVTKFEDTLSIPVIHNNKVFKSPLLQKNDRNYKFTKEFIIPFFVTRSNKKGLSFDIAYLTRRSHLTRKDIELLPDECEFVDYKHYDDFNTAINENKNSVEMGKVKYVAVGKKNYGVSNKIIGEIVATCIFPIKSKKNYSDLYSFFSNPEKECNFYKIKEQGHNEKQSTNAG